MSWQWFSTCGHSFKSLFGTRPMSEWYQYRTSENRSKLELPDVSGGPCFSSPLSFSSLSPFPISSPASTRAQGRGSFEHRRKCSAYPGLVVSFHLEMEQFCIPILSLGNLLTCDASLLCDCLYTVAITYLKYCPSFCSFIDACSVLYFFAMDLQS